MILMASSQMDANKKPDREENSLVRMPAIARKNLDLGTEQVEVTGIVKQGILNIHQAFSKDIKIAKSRLSDDELKKVVFVTTSIFKKLTGEDKTLVKDVWISKPPFTTLIGADPEFLLFDKEGNVVHANNILEKPGKIGSDGAMIEIRPEPSPHPETLVKNMKSIFNDRHLTEPIKDLDWQAAVYHKNKMRDYPVGGHIHLGNPIGITKLSETEKFFLFAVMNKIMDELLALPLIKLDGTNLGKYRRSECQMAMGNIGYGYYGEWRACEGRLEHRTLSGLWLMHPFVAECVLGTAKAISEELFKRIEDSGYAKSKFNHPGIAFDNHKFLYRGEFDDWNSISLAKSMECVSSSAYMASMLNQSKARSITKPFLKKWYNKMKKLSTYDKYYKAVDGLYSILILPKTSVYTVGLDIKKNWLGGRKFPV